MNSSITGSLIVCAGAALFTVGALVVNSGAPDPIAAPTSGTSAAGGGPPPGPAAPYGEAAPRTPSTPSTGGSLTIQDFAFGPVSAGPGARVTVDNRDGVAHTVTNPDGLFDSGAIAATRAATLVAPAQVGTYRFVCLVHPQMAGTLVVR